MALPEAVPVAPRDDVISFGILPISLLVPQRGESPGCLLALHKTLAAKAVVNGDGEGGWQWRIASLIAYPAF